MLRDAARPISSSIESSAERASHSSSSEPSSCCTMTCCTASSSAAVAARYSSSLGSISSIDPSSKEYSMSGESGPAVKPPPLLLLLPMCRRAPLGSTFC